MNVAVSFSSSLRKNPFTGRYIAIEGIDGSGKTTQIQRLRRHFQKKRETVIVTSEPRRDLPVGNIITRILNARIKLPSIAYQFLYSANRIENHETIIYPALQAGKIVLSHRSVWSIVPYGIEDFGLSSIDKQAAESFFAAHGVLSYYYQSIIPDMTLYLRVSVKTAMRRLSAMNKTKELYERKEKLRVVTKGYEWESEQFSENIVIIDGEKPVDLVTKEILTNVSTLG